MSSGLDVQPILAVLQLNNYITLVLLAAISYDYCLTFSKEVTYIWKRPWTTISSLFLLIRYVGYLCAFASALPGSTFISGEIKRTLKTPMILDVSYALFVLANWAYMTFWLAADIVMVLRVYAMYNRSKIVLGLLLAIYIVEVAFFFVEAGIYSDPNYDIVSVIQILDITMCNAFYTTGTWSTVPAAIQCVLGGVMCILLVIKFASDSIQMHRATGKWEVNRYIHLLARDGSLYFFTTLFNNLLVLLGSPVSLGQAPIIIVISVFASVLLFTLTPRFVMNIREMYVLDGQVRVYGGIDTGFGLGSQTRRGAGTTTSGMVAFAEVGTTGGLEDEQETATLEQRADSEDNGRQVSEV